VEANHGASSETGGVGAVVRDGGAGAREGAAQITGSIGGTIHDASGAVLPGAAVAARGPNLQKEAATAVSGANGTYRVALIPPGRYDVTVELQGFAPPTRKNVEVAINQQTTLDFSMAVGGRTEAVVVEAEIALNRSVGPQLRDADDVLPWATDPVRGAVPLRRPIGERSTGATASASRGPRGRRPGCSRP
jgi:hypothetical protein